MRVLKVVEPESAPKPDRPKQVAPNALQAALASVSDSCHLVEYAQAVAEISVLIPSINSRPSYLPLAIESARLAGATEVLLCGPSPETFSPQVIATIDRFITEQPHSALASKISDGLSAIESEYQCWLGDDDLLTPGSLDRAVAYLSAHPEAVAVFGACEYMDARGHTIALNQSGTWAVPLLRFGPQLIPQPSVVWRTSAFRQTTGLNPRYQLAFDFDLLVQLSKLGKIGYLPDVQSRFRWHPDSLSVKRRWQSVKEASWVRRSYYPGWAKPLALLWEPIVMLATWLAGKLLSLKLRMSSRRAVS